MSGIAGIYYRDERPVAFRAVHAMIGAIAHRGPDGSRCWVEGAVGLAQCSLHTTPEACHERQPHVSNDGQIVLVADARIDNRDELCRMLNLEAGGSTIVTDTDIILAAYQRWGRGCADYLIGAFAIVLWDVRAQQLICIRDHAGLRPLYYHVTPSCFVFASEIKALFALPEVPRRINEERIAAHLTTVVPLDPTMTWFDGIIRMPPAHIHTIGPEDAFLLKYWSLDPERELRMPSDEAYAEAFREHFTEAVRCRLRSTSPVGAALSGGLDSSSIACVARDLLRARGEGPLHTFSVIFPNLPEAMLPAIDEREYIRVVHETGGFRKHFFQADEYSPLWQEARVVRQMDEGIWAPNLYLHLGMYDLAHKAGVRVFLDGIDGDSTVSHGIEYLSQLYLERRWNELEQQICALAQRNKRPPTAYVRHHVYANLEEQTSSHNWGRLFEGMEQLHSRLGIPRRELVARHLLPEVLPDVLYTRWKACRGRTGEGSTALMNRDFARRLGRENGPLGFTDALSDTCSTAREGHINNLSDVLFGPLLELADRMSGVRTVESRFPFFDRRLIEFCVAMPPEQKLRDGWTRYILRRAMEGILPPAVQWRKEKANLEGNFVRNMWAFEQDTFQDMLESEGSVLEPYVDRAALHVAFERALAISDDPKRSNETRDLYTALMLQKWLLHNHGNS